MNPVSCVRFLPYAHFEGMKQEEATGLKSVSGGRDLEKALKNSGLICDRRMGELGLRFATVVSSLSVRPLRASSSSRLARAGVSPFAVGLCKKELEKLKPALESSTGPEPNESAFPSHLQTWDENST